MGEIRYQFGDLGDGSSALANTANGVAAEKDNWGRTVGITAETWRDVAGGRFVELGHLWDQAAASTTEFQLALSRAVAQAQANGQEALGRAMSALG
ncbi:hypothetical protein [Actinokineospora bangkokensis]|uniref:WXG100 family type VII secretion target n=1 Tax=Actinokineospora bangkokensis TaxID=1193682 RepID=A0A1Q9LTD6_9PSEU|nr:hypothetical protein [Actinokineospora bangkokensis]OLR95295.1 hypothetical protein BJP25_07375 [Actinokineospora bangkokensis]